MISLARLLAAALLLTSACARPTGTGPASDGSVAPAHPAVSPVSPVSPLASLPPEQRAAYEGADAIVIATLIDPKIASVLESEPPIYVHEFGLAVERTLRGMPIPSNTLTFSSRAHEKPFAAGARYVVAVRRTQENLVEIKETFTALRIEPATASPETTLASAFTPAPAGLRITVKQVAPTTPRKWDNDYGDGLFDLTIVNDGDVPRVVPGLTTDVGADGQVLFEDALEIRDDHGRVLRMPRSAAKGTSVTLPPHGTLVTRVDVKPFGLVQPYGGSREYYSFAIGSLRASSFFYYSHTLHGPLMGKP